MKITMKITTPGSPDGSAVKKYMAGESYGTPEDISKKLANIFIDMGVADYYTSTPKPEETAVVVQAPEIKEDVVEEIETAEPVDEDIDDIEDAEIVEDDEDTDIDTDDEKEPEKSDDTNVSDLAKELGLKSKEISDIAKKLKISASHHKSKLTGEEADKIKAEIKKD